MEESELKKLWQTTNEKLEEKFVISKQHTEDIIQLKIYNYLLSMRTIKLITILIGVLWVGMGISLLIPMYLYSFSEVNKFFLLSATIQVLVTAIALTIYVYQLIKISQVEIEDSVLQTQQNIAQLKISTLWATRILCLQLPVWTTFWWNETMLTDWNFFQWTVTLLITLGFTYMSLWLFFNINYENRNKKWFQLMFNGKEWNPLMKSMALLEQVEDYQIDKSVK